MPMSFETSLIVWKSSEFEIIANKFTLIPYTLFCFSVVFTIVLVWNISNIYCFTITLIKKNAGLALEIWNWGCQLVLKNLKICGCQRWCSAFQWVPGTHASIITQVLTKILCFWDNYFSNIANFHKYIAIGYLYPCLKR